MLRLTLLCSCFLFPLITSRHTEGEPLTWRQLAGYDITLEQTPNFYQDAINRTVEYESVEIEKPYTKPESVSESKVKGNEIDMEAIVKVKLKTQVESKAKLKSTIKGKLGIDNYVNAESQAKSKPELKAEVETETNTVREKEAGVEAATPPEIYTKSKLKVGKDEKPDTQGKVRVKLGSMLKVGQGMYALSKLNGKLESEVKPTETLRLDDEEETNIVMEMQINVMPELKVRALPRSFTDAFKRSTSVLLNPASVVDSGLRTMRLFVDWVKTSCSSLTLDQNLLTKTYRRLISGGGGDSNGAKGIPRSSSGVTKFEDMGLKTLTDSRDIRISPVRNDNAYEVPVDEDFVYAPGSVPELPLKTKKTLGRYRNGADGKDLKGIAGILDDDDAFKTPPGSPQKSPKKSPAESQKEPHQDAQPLKTVDGDKSGGGNMHPRSRYTSFNVQSFRNRFPAFGAGDDDERREMNAERLSPKFWETIPSRSRKESPPKSQKESPTKDKRRGNGSQFADGELERSAGLGRDAYAPKLPLPSPPISPPRSPKESPRKSQEESQQGLKILKESLRKSRKQLLTKAKQGGNAGHMRGGDFWRGPDVGQDAYAPNTLPSSLPIPETENSPQTQTQLSLPKSKRDSPPKPKLESPPRSPPKETKNGEAGRVGSWNRYRTFNAQEFRERFSDFGTGEESENQKKHDDIPARRLFSSSFDKEGFNDPNSWKIVWDKFGNQKKDR